MNNLARAYRGQGQYGQAEPLFAQVLQLRREVLGPRDPATLRSMRNLAEAYWDQGRYGEAEPLVTEELSLRREILGPHHPDTLTSMNNLEHFLSEPDGTLAHVGVI
jgi:tetratricopeptide (TPR) repeat protein